PGKCFRRWRFGLKCRSVTALLSGSSKGGPYNHECRPIASARPRRSRQPVAERFLAGPAVGEPANDTGVLRRPRVPCQGGRRFVEKPRGIAFLCLPGLLRADVVSVALYRART